MYLIQEKVQLKGDTGFAHGNGLRIAPKADSNVGGADIPVEVKKNRQKLKASMTDMWKGV